MNKTARALISTAAAVPLLILPACGGHTAAPRANYQVCVREIVTSPDKGPWPACEGLTHDQLVKATYEAMAQGAIG